jgi:hypothetical protein
MLADYILVSEPEAAAIYTARHLKQEHGKDLLKVRYNAPERLNG